MKQLKYIVMMLVSFTLLSSCEEELAVDINFVPKIVLNSIFTTDSIWTIHLTTTRNNFDPNSTSVNILDAQVLIVYSTGQTACELKHIGNGIYSSKGYIPKDNTYYSIIAKSKTFGTVSAQSIIPQKAKVKDLVVSNLPNGNSEVNFQIEDTSADLNYFIWDVVNMPKDFEPSQHNHPDNINLTTWVDQVKNNIKFTKFGHLNQNFSAENNGTTVIDSKIVTNLDTKKDTTDTPQEEFKKMLRVMTVSKDLFDYYRSIEKYVKYNEGNSSVNNHQDIFNNVKGGFGIFAGYAVEYVELQ